LAIVITTGCVDRLSMDISADIGLRITIDGQISDQPGPYEIRINRVYDIEAKETWKTPISVKALTISDSQGHTEALKDIDVGVYQTSATGIRGIAGRVYTMRVELFDGRIYESLPDTIMPAGGSVDTLYYEFNKRYTVVGEQRYDFDLLFDASYDNKINNHFLWSFLGTFQAETQPEQYHGGACFWLDEISRCNMVPPCSGYRNIGTNRFPVLQKQYPCTCCQCWYNLFNSSPILSDDHVVAAGRVTKAKVMTIPINKWTLEHKIRLAVSQLSLTRSTYLFWKAIRDQQEATGNLFQPVSGKVPRNFVQIAGQPIPIEGLFFAASINQKVKYVDRFQLPPDLVYAIPLDKPIFGDDCRELFSNSTIQKPAWWKD
jgi:hypothetical protein